MTRSHLSRALSVSLLSLVIAPFGASSARAADYQGPTMDALIVSGGPTLDHNQVAIESNARYMLRLLPSTSRTRVLFADGNKSSPNVLFMDAKGKDQYRATELPFIDGPNMLENFDKTLKEITVSRDQNPNTPLLLYFTGHGSPRPGNVNNAYDMWAGNALDVQHLAGSLKSLPPSIPVTLVMVQCFSGAFGNLLFENGDPKGAPINRNLCGFFASIPQRYAAGCTSEVNEADYHDFTSYFIAALSGQDRQGRPVLGADYNHDGKVGMNEAFAYALSHDYSIDTPSCTSDFFLRRYVPLTEDEFSKYRYSQIQSWASPAQLAALNELSNMLELKGEDRVMAATRSLENSEVQSFSGEAIFSIRFVRLAKSIVLGHTLMTSSDGALKDRFQSLLAAEAGSPFWQPLRKNNS